MSEWVSEWGEWSEWSKFVYTQCKPTYLNFSSRVWCVCTCNHSKSVANKQVNASDSRQTQITWNFKGWFWYTHSVYASYPVNKIIIKVIFGMAILAAIDCIVLKKNMYMRQVCGKEKYPNIFNINIMLINSKFYFKIALLVTWNRFNLRLKMWYLVTSEGVWGWVTLSGALAIGWILFCREIEYGGGLETFPSLQPKSECLCPEKFPRAISNENGFSFYCARNHQPDDDKVPRHVHRDGGRLFLAEYLTDGVYEATFHKDVNKGRGLPINSLFIKSHLILCVFCVINRRSTLLQ